MTKHLESSPATLPLLARAALGVIPGSGKLPFLAGGGGAVPDLELELADLEVDAGRLSEYARVCGFRLGDALPATYPHVLAFPLHMRLLTDPSFPFRQSVSSMWPTGSSRAARSARSNRSPSGSGRPNLNGIRRAARSGC